MPAQDGCWRALFWTTSWDHGNSNLSLIATGHRHLFLACPCITSLDLHYDQVKCYHPRLPAEDTMAQR